MAGVFAIRQRHGNTALHVTCVQPERQGLFTEQFFQAEAVPEGTGNTGEESLLPSLRILRVTDSM